MILLAQLCLRLDSPTSSSWSPSASSLTPRAQYGADHFLAGEKCKEMQFLCGWSLRLSVGEGFYRLWSILAGLDIWKLPYFSSLGKQENGCFRKSVSYQNNYIVINSPTTSGTAKIWIYPTFFNTLVPIKTYQPTNKEDH